MNMTKRKKIILKIFVTALLLPVILFLLLTILIYIPAVQNAIVTEVSEIASKESGMDITVGRVCLKFPLDLEVNDVKVIKPCGDGRDTIADVRRIIVDVKLMPLFNGHVDIDDFTFENARINTADLVAAARVKGEIGKFYLKSRGVDLNNDSVTINRAVLDKARIAVTLNDSVEEDTTASENNWKIFASDISLSNTDVTLVMSGDTLVADARMKKIKAYGTDLNLGRGVYKLRSLSAEGLISYDNIYADSIVGFDYNHIQLANILLAADSVMYSPERTRASLTHLQFTERSGINLLQMKGRVDMDSVHLNIPQMMLQTDNSELTMTADMDLNALDENNEKGRCNALINGYLGKQDIMLFLGAMPADFRRQWPAQPMRITASCSGNVKEMEINRVAVNLPTAFNVTADGILTDVTNEIGGRIDVGLNTYDMAFVTSLVDYPLNIPYIKGDAKVRINGSRYDADLLLMQQDSASVNASAFYDTKTLAYEASLDMNNINMHDFLPSDSIYNVDAMVTVKGRNTDVFSKYTNIDFEGRINRLVYGDYDISGVHTNGRLDNGHAIADVYSDNDMLRGRITFDALLDKKKIETTFACDIIEADLQHMGLYKESVKAGICAHVDLSTDMEEYFRINGYMSDITIKEEKKVHRPSSIMMNINTNADTTYADVKCGDMDLFVDADGGVRRLITVGDTIMSKLKQQFDARIINQRDIISSLPNANIRMHSGPENFFAKVMQFYGVEFKTADMQLNISPKTGLNGNIDVLAMKSGEVLLDTINLAVMSDSTECRYAARIKNNLRNPRYVFTALSDGYVFDRGLGLNLKYIDRTTEVGLDIGLKASMLERGIKCELSKLDPIIGYTVFNVNEKNHIYFDKTGRLSANMKFTAPDGSGFMLFSDDENIKAMQDITLTLHKMNLEKIFSVIPYMPRITGEMNGDFHVEQSDDLTTMSADVHVDEMTYEKSPMGDIGTELVYMPLNDGTHFVDGRITQFDREIVSLSGKYIPEGNDNFDINMKMLRFPMDITNGLFPYHLLGLYGYAEGEISLKGSMSKPIVDGELFLDSSYVESVPFGVEMRFANDPVRIVGSNLLFENFELFSHNDNPLDLYGNLDFSDLDDINMKIKMQAHDFLLVDSKEKKYSVAYGKALVDFYGMMRGSLNNLKVTGMLEVSNNTDLIYILRDSPLSTDNRMDDLVKFVNFQDTAHVEKERPELSGVDMDMHVVVQDGAHVVCNLNADKTNYIDLMGGGRLRMQYNALDDFRLTGKYTLTSGEMKYSLPVIPLKTFSITDGSYVEFTGDAMNPRLNITATENTSASVSGDDGSTRSVEFDCGVEVTRTLNDMGLKFIISAPDDMSVQNQLASMSEEQRGKIAVTMLTTGMYLTDGNTSAFSMNNALSSFLQSEINQIASSAMKTMDVSVGVDNSTSATGGQHTDYSFKFAKRFWNNRMKIIVGGSVSTGSDIERSNNTFFDNVSFEYRLDKSSNKNLRMFYERDSYDLLEGEVSEYGVGFVFRKRMRHFMDLFRKEKKVKLFEDDNIGKKKEQERNEEAVIPTEEKEQKE